MTIVPTTITYLNTSIGYAVLSCLMAVFTEVAARVATVLFMKRGYEKKLDKLLAEGKPAEAKKLEFEYRLALQALRWNAEIIGEKVSILTSGRIAYEFFPSSSMSELDLALLCGIFFVMEAVSDTLFVSVVHFMGVPMLSAIPRRRFLSKEFLVVATMTAFMSPRCPLVSGWPAR